MRKRVIEYAIDNIVDRQKISGFLRVKGYSAQILTDLKKCSEAVRVNGRPAPLNFVLHNGDLLTVTIMEDGNSDQIQPVFMPIEIVYEDEDILVVNKPAGMPIHPSKGNALNSLGNALMELYAKRGENFVYRCINRLDRDTSGLTVIAKHSLSAAVLGSQVRERTHAAECGAAVMHREYLAVVQGRFQETCGTVREPIGRVDDTALRMAVDPVHGLDAVTHYRVLAEGAEASLVACRLETGRTHQIRVHMQHLGHPLLGDYLYHPDYRGNQTDRVKEGEMRDDCAIARQMLHAWKLSFVHPVTGEAMQLEAPIPDDMQQVMNLLFS